MLIGDTGKLPAASGRVIWKHNANKENGISSLNMRKEFKTVITIQDDNAKDILYDNLLTRLIYGKCTTAYYNEIHTK